MEVDIAIIGGGVAGCTAAIALAKFYNVLLIDKTDKPIKRIGECLAPAAGRILKQFDLLDGLEKAQTQSGQALHLKNIGTKSYWGSDQMQVVDHLRNPDGFGWHLDRQAFEMYLRETAAQRGVTCHWGAKLNDIFYEDFRWYLGTSIEHETDQQTKNFSAKFVIDASGRQSQFARKLGIHRDHFDKLIACWASVTDFEQNKMSTISADESGWWYSASVPGNKRVIAFQTDSDLMAEPIKSSNQFFELAQSNREIAEILERCNGDIELHATVAANSTRLSSVAGQQWVALGDAALSLDPLSSQGMFNAMAGAAQLADLIKEINFINRQDSLRTNQFEKIYTYQMDQIWAHYMKHKQLFYRAETRWKEASFWKRRH
jgi:flavin-dependent dehydrogenase